MPRTIETIHREHVEASIRQLLERWTPSTAHNRYAGLQRIFKWAVSEDLIKDSPMARMRPPAGRCSLSVRRLRRGRSVQGVEDLDHRAVWRRPHVTQLRQAVRHVCEEEITRSAHRLMLPDPDSFEEVS